MLISGSEDRISNRPAYLKPYFSICIPQYNRTDFLLKSCESLVAQSFRDFEVCISDDCSTDGRQEELVRFLQSSTLIFTYAVNSKNLRYDGNLRRAIELSAGQFVVLLGNDDGLIDSEVLESIRWEISRARPVAVAITNYRELPSKLVYRRVGETKVLGGGPAIAASAFRNYSFLSGVVFHGDRAREEATDCVDGSEMYQMYLGTRLVARGGRLLAIDRVCIEKDLQIAGQSVDNYRLRPRIRPCPVVPRSLPMGRLLEVVAAGLGPYHDGRGRNRNVLSVAGQLYLFTYPFWLLEYRRVQSWRYSLGVFLGLSPGRLAKGLSLSRFALLEMWSKYLIAGALGLLTPIRLFDLLRPRLYALAKRQKRRLR